LNAWCAARIHRFLSAAGLDLSAGARHSLAAIRRQLRLRPRLERMLAFFLRTLEEEAWVRLEAEALTVLSSPDEIADPSALSRQALARFPALRPILSLAESCAAQYGPALSGDVEAVGVLFGADRGAGTIE